MLRCARRRAKKAQPWVVAQKTRAERGGSGAVAVDVEEEEGFEKSDGGRMAEEVAVVFFSRPLPLSDPTPCKI